MHLYETPGIQYFEDNIVIYVQGLRTRNLFWTWAPSLHHFADVSFVSELHFRKMVRVHSAIYLQVIIFQFKIMWEIVFWNVHGSCICVGKHEVTLLYNWLALLKLSISLKHWEAESIFIVGTMFNLFTYSIIFGIFFCFIIMGVFLIIFAILSSPVVKWEMNIRGQSTQKTF
jgi:hypothetical protein